MGILGWGFGMGILRWLSWKSQLEVKNPISIQIPDTPMIGIVPSQVEIQVCFPGNGFAPALAANSSLEKGMRE